MRRANVETEENGGFTPQRRTIDNAVVGKCYRDDFGNTVLGKGGGIDQATKSENSKKKTKKWSLSGLFKKHRAKSSDTDSSCETDGKKTGFLSRNSRRRNNGGSRKVVGKFEAIVLPKDDLSSPRTRNGVGASRPDDIQLYDASPNVIKRNRFDATMADGGGGEASPCNREPRTRDRWRANAGSGGSLDAVVRRNDKSKIKARAEAMRDRLRDDSSSSDEQRPSSSSRNSNCSLQMQRFQPVDYATRTGFGPGPGSRSRKCRVNRRRQSNDEAVTAAGSSFSNADPSQPPSMAASPKSRWFARVVYQQSNDYPMRYTARTRSATSSPMSSPLAKPKTFQSCSLPSTCKPYSFDLESRRRDQDCETLSPPSPPPRNPNRKTVASAAVTARNYPYTNRPSSYAFDANARQKEISSFIQYGGSGRDMDEHYADNNNNNNNHKGGDEEEEGDINDNLSAARYKSQSHGELRTPRRNVFPVFGGRSYPKNSDGYGATQPLRSDVYINRNLYADEKPAAYPSTNERAENPWHADSVDRDGRWLRKANEIGIPVAGDFGIEAGTTASLPVKSVRTKPASRVAETSASNTGVSASGSLPSKPKPRNLEEALVELEEIYDSLKLSDDDLLDRADRRDLQAALKMHHPRYDYRDEDEDGVDASPRSPNRPNRPRLPTSRRSAFPDAVTDDMAYRKLRRNDNGGDVKSNPNLVSQSGSFLLMSATLSPPPLVDVQPTSTPPPFAKEPDVTLDDVVFRNIRHTNNTLRVSDPQPPFGIPLSPVPAAPYSDYLHAIPSDKYRSTFNPSRVPDVVKDDLAYRNLRKDFRNESDARAPVPAAAFKKRRAIRSLSANVVSLLGQRSTSDHVTVDPAFDTTSIHVPSDHKYASYAHLPSISDEWRQWRPNEREFGGCCDEDDGDDDDDETLNLVAKETRALGKALEIKLRELEAKTQTQSETVPSTTLTSSNGVHGDLFAKRVVVHKPITLSGFKIGHGAATEAKNARNETGHLVADNGRQLKLAERLENVDKRTNRGNGTMEGDRDRLGDHIHVHVVQPCPDFNWNDVRKEPLASPPPLEPTTGRVNLKCDKTTENSSSGVSSTSNTPDSARKCRIVRDDASRASDRDVPDNDNDDDNECAQRSYLGEEVLPSFERRVSQQFSQPSRNTFECTDVDAVATPTHTTSNAAEAAKAPVKKDFCSRFEITLVTPQPAGTSRNCTTQCFENLPPNDAFVHLIYLAACLCEFFFATYSIYELLLVLVSSLAYFALTRT